jgi:transcription initiation factor TFIID subunit 5
MDRTARLWHLERTHPLRTFLGHTKDVDAVATHPNCDYLATASTDGTVRFWSHSDAKLVRRERLAIRLQNS